MRMHSCTCSRLPGRTMAGTRVPALERAGLCLVETGAVRDDVLRAYRIGPLPARDLGQESRHV